MEQPICDKTIAHLKQVDIHYTIITLYNSAKAVTFQILFFVPVNAFLMLHSACYSFVYPPCVPLLAYRSYPLLATHNQATMLSRHFSIMNMQSVVFEE